MSELYNIPEYSETEQDKAELIYVDGKVIYQCLAVVGTVASSALWQIAKINTTSSPYITQWADGNDLYDNVATNLATVKGLSYS
jgi:hypothetical protein